jgi:ABC-type sugar transport system ATPase subunit
MSALVLDGVRIALGDRALIDGLDLTIDAGRCVTLMGPSGCGKSTLLAFVAGFIDPCSTRAGACAWAATTSRRRRRNSAASASCSRTTSCFRT